jgi:hypothetical protein
VLGDGCALAYVDGDVAGVHALLDLAHLGVLATTTEQAGGLHTEVANLGGQGDGRGGGALWVRG